jgi:hypothetical protein
VKQSPDPASGKHRTHDLDAVSKLARKVDPPREATGRYRKGKKATPAAPRPHQVQD